jgi:O-antigen ligase
MTVFSPSWTPEAGTLRRAGVAALWGGLVIAVAVILGVLWVAPDVLPLVPILLVGGAVVVGLARRPLAHLCAVLLASAMVLEHEPGVQIEEVLWGLYAMAYLAAWAIADLYERRTLLEPGGGRLLLGFLLVAFALVPVAFLHGGTPHTVVREMTSLVMVAFFFPVRDAVRRHPNGLRALLGVVLALTVFVVGRNVMTYLDVLNNAERLADMVAGRVVANEHILAAGSLFGGVFLLYARTLPQAGSAAVVFLLSFGALLLSLSRGFWLAFVWGVLLILWAVDGRRRIRIVVMGVLAALAIVAVAFIFFGNFAEAYVAGLMDRLGSVQGSTKRDISMLGRIYEGRAALGHIALNPIIGHGVGVPFTFSTILTRTEITTTFVHNGYIYLWYAFGLPGSVLILLFWWRGIAAGLHVFKRTDAPRLARLTALAVAASLFCYTLSAMTSNPFWHKDYLLGFGFLAGLAYGLRSTFETPAPAAAP